MPCPQSNLILRLVSNELSPAEELTIRQHLEVCSACQTAYVELLETWDVLGAWEIEPARQDLRPGVAELVDRDKRYAFSTVSGILRRPMLLRAVAAVVLAVGAGIAAGLLTPVEVSHRERQRDTAATSSEDLEALGMAEFGANSATGLPLSLEAEAAHSQEKAS